MESLSAALDDLYGGSIEPSVRKKGETQAVGFVASFLDDAFAPGQTRILEDSHREPSFMREIKSGWQIRLRLKETKGTPASSTCWAELREKIPPTRISGR